MCFLVSRFPPGSFSNVNRSAKGCSVINKTKTFSFVFFSTVF